MRKKQNDCARRAATVTNSMDINSQMTRIYTFQHSLTYLVTFVYSLLSENHL